MKDKDFAKQLKQRFVDVPVPPSLRPDEVMRRLEEPSARKKAAGRTGRRWLAVAAMLAVAVTVAAVARGIGLKPGGSGAPVADYHSDSAASPENDAFDVQQGEAESGEDNGVQAPEPPKENENMPAQGAGPARSIWRWLWAPVAVVAAGACAALWVIGKRRRKERH